MPTRGITGHCVHVQVLNSKLHFHIQAHAPGEDTLESSGKRTRFSFSNSVPYVGTYITLGPKQLLTSKSCYTPGTTTCHAQCKSAPRSPILECKVHNALWMAEAKREEMLTYIRSLPEWGRGTLFHGLVGTSVLLAMSLSCILLHEWKSRERLGIESLKGVLGTWAGSRF